MMVLKDFFAKTTEKLRNFKLPKISDFHPEVDEQGLLSEDGQEETAIPIEKSESQQNDAVLVKSVQPADKNVQLEKLQSGFNKLVEQLQGINENLNRQISQNQELTGKMENLPELLKNVPDAVESQSKMMTSKCSTSLRENFKTVKSTY